MSSSVVTTMMTMTTTRCEWWWRGMTRTTRTTTTTSMPRQSIRRILPANCITVYDADRVDVWRFPFGVCIQCASYRLNVAQSNLAFMCDFWWMVQFHVCNFLGRKTFVCQTTNLVETHACSVLRISSPFQHASRFMFFGSLFPFFLSFLFSIWLLLSIFVSEIFANPPFALKRSVNVQTVVVFLCAQLSPSRNVFCGQTICTRLVEFSRWFFLLLICVVFDSRENDG